MGLGGRPAVTSVLSAALIVTLVLVALKYGEMKRW